MKDTCEIYDHRTADDLLFNDLFVIHNAHGMNLTDMCKATSHALLRAAFRDVTDFNDIFHSVKQSSIEYETKDGTICMDMEDKYLN